MTEPGEFIKSRQRIKITSFNGDGTIYNDIRIGARGGSRTYDGLDDTQVVDSMNGQKL